VQSANFRLDSDRAFGVKRLKEYGKPLLDCTEPELGSAVCNIQRYTYQPVLQQAIV
jgi:hypothetical protein